MGLTVWVTRTQPGAQNTASRLRAMGHQPLVAPLLEVRPCKSADIDLDGADVLVFTSINGVNAFADLSYERHLTVVAVGGATAAAAREAGFDRVFNIDGAVADLARQLAWNFPGGTVVAPGARERAGDLAGLLADKDVMLREITVYETVEVAPPADFNPESVDLALVHSPKGGRALAAFLSQHPAPHLEVACISLAAAAPLAATPLERLDAAASPNEDALLALI